MQQFGEWWGVGPGSFTQRGMIPALNQEQQDIVIKNNRIGLELFGTQRGATF
jgi:hypothetical protein